MREFIGHWITIMCEVIAFIVTAIWYINSKELEPLAGLIILFGSIIVSILTRKSKKADEAKNNIVNIKGNKNKVIQDVSFETSLDKKKDN